MTETLYKWTSEDGGSYHGGKGRWTKNRWRSVSGPLEPCYNGLHLCRERDLSKWAGPVLWVAEHEGELVEQDDKVVVRKARVVERLDGWNERTARLFAADCAERVLPLFEGLFPNDDRPRLVIQAVRDYANGLINDAAREAARDAAWEAVWPATSAEAARAARAAAWAAAWPAWASARDAAWASAGTEAAAWQGERILLYAKGTLG